MPDLLRLLTSLLLLLISMATAQADETLSESVAVEVKPLLKALSMIGTPYKFGSNNPAKGLDCSGFVKYVYKVSADITLPRTAHEMSREGRSVAKEELEPGDLVFFNTRKLPNSHVGIYAGNGEFVHASSSHTKEVMVSRLSQEYWARHFNGARRILLGSPQ